MARTALCVAGGNGLSIATAQYMNTRVSCFHDSLLPSSSPPQATSKAPQYRRPLFYIFVEVPLVQASSIPSLSITPQHLLCCSVIQQQSCCTSSRFWRWWALPMLCQTPQPTVRRLLQPMAPLRRLRRHRQLRQARSQSAARLRHRNTLQHLPEATQLRPALLLAPLTAMAGTAATQPTRTLQARPAS